MNMLGHREKYEQAPFLWPALRGADLGTAPKSSALSKSASGWCACGRTGVSRDRESLAAELELETSRESAASQVS